MGINLLLQAELAAIRFSKIRLFIPTKEVDKTRQEGYTIEWPRSALKKLPSPNKLKKLGLKTDSFFRSIDLYRYTHSEYEEIKNEKYKLDYLRFKVLRNYYCIKRLKKIPTEQISDLKIRVGYRETILPKEGLNTNNSKLVENLKMREDIEWFFNIQSCEFRARMPGYFGPFIFNEKNLFQKKSFIPVSRPSYGSQRNKDDRSISNIYAVASQDKTTFKHIADFSYSSLVQLVDDEELFTRCNEIVNDFESEKVGL